MRTLSRKEAASYCGVDVQTIDRLIAARKLRVSYLGRRVIIRDDDLVALLDASVRRAS